jgi:hypothetical protein
VRSGGRKRERKQDKKNGKNKRKKKERGKKGGKAIRRNKGRSTIFAARDLQPTERPGLFCFAEE